ncbi:hypothetical protein H0H93_005834 [Arthromyces matolae]|nr:hypothetical protein H0H93_005834 [Arthromyces matolae]
MARIKAASRHWLTKVDTGRGRIHHIQAMTPEGNKFADEIFKEYQEHASAGTLKFRRWPMRAYVGGTANTVSFEETSSAVTKARDLIQSRILQALGKRCYFNEVLSDSERGLGPVVAGLSLGSPALMHFRQHQKNIPKREDESNPIVLTVVLRHGDVLVMDGASIQDRYE